MTPIPVEYQWTFLSRMRRVSFLDGHAFPPELVEAEWGQLAAHVKTCFEWYMITLANERWAAMGAVERRVFLQDNGFGIGFVHCAPEWAHLGMNAQRQFTTFVAREQGSEINAIRYEYRMAWNIRPDHGAGSWHHETLRGKLEASISALNPIFGVESHWLESRPILAKEPILSET